MNRTNRHGLAILDAARTVRPSGRVEAGETMVVRLLAPCVTPGCRHSAVYPRPTGDCCPDCLPAVLVAEARNR